MEKTYQKFLQQNIDLAALGVERRSENVPYFCTPKGASFIGWAGVDGIHFCFIRDFGEMVFSVSPMNSAPQFVHPLARDFADFLGLLLACGDSAALEQAWQLDEKQFGAFLRENQPTEEQNSVLAQIARQMELAPMAQPWQYITQLQSEFDYRKIPYTEAYYDLVPSSETSRKSAWKVYFDGNFWGHESGQQAGKEIRVDAHLDWAGHYWVIPAVYACAKGLVVDYCMQVEPGAIWEFLEKWDLTAENEFQKEFTQEQRMQIRLDNPLELRFNTVLQVNGKQLQAKHGCGLTYDPCLDSDEVLELETQQAVQHYGLDPVFGWVITRSCYPWATKRKPKFQSLKLSMMLQKSSIPGPRFRVQKPGDAFAFSYPEGGAEYTLTVQEYEAQNLEPDAMEQPDMVFPTCFHVMRYTVSPEPPEGLLTLTDCADGDRPRRVQQTGCIGANDAAIGIIGGADGPTMLVFGEKPGKLRAAYSSLHFDPVEEVEWRIVFHEKPFADGTFVLHLP